MTTEGVKGLLMCFFSFFSGYKSIRNLMRTSEV